MTLKGLFKSEGCEPSVTSAGGGKKKEGEKKKACKQ